jgi:uncharacterized protein (DUF433 family)
MADVERHAQAVGLKVTALVERYLDEGLRRDDHPLIGFREGSGGRRAALAGTRLDVGQVIETLRNSDNSVADTAAYLGISEAYVRACVRYYAFYQGEVDEWIERMHAIADHEQEAWRREQAMLA